MFRSAETRYASLRDRVEAQHGELQKLQVRCRGCRGSAERLPGWGLATALVGSGLLSICMLSTHAPTCPSAPSVAQERLKAAEGEYARSLSNLKSAASELQGLGSRVHSSSKAANGEGRQAGNSWGLAVRCTLPMCCIGILVRNCAWPAARQLDCPSSHLPISLTPPALVRDLRELPSKAALQLRSDAANTAAVAGNQSAAVQKFVKRIAKQYGI